jgi:outer membrane protein
MRRFILVAILLAIFSEGNGQPLTRFFTLDEVVALAREISPDAMAARHRYRGSYWQFRSFQAGYLPNLRLDATLPNLNRTISPVTLPDGTDIFVRRSLATSSANLALSQTIGLTGGSCS